MASQDRPTFSRRHLVRALLGRDTPPQAAATAEAPDRHAAGDAAFAAGDYPAAVAAYRQSVRGDLSHAPARLRLGQALFATGQYIQARVEFEHVLHLTHGVDPAARLLLGLTFLALGKTDKAAANLEAFADPDRPELETAAREAARRLTDTDPTGADDPAALGRELAALAGSSALFPEFPASSA